MAITRRQFVTRLGALAAAAGMSQGQIAKLSEAFAEYSYPNGSFDWKTASGKPTVVWVHGAECTGCSTSLLGLFEDARGIAIEGTTINTAAALNAAVGGDIDDASYNALLGSHRTLNTNGYNVDAGGTGTVDAAEGAYVVNIQDVLIDIIELDYHETVMSMGGDLAAQWLKDFIDNVDGGYDGCGNAHTGAKPFVLVVEGAVQDASGNGAWSDVSGNGKPWCSIGMSYDYDGGSTGFEHSFDAVVARLAAKATVVVPIGQCATFGGYPGATPPLDGTIAGFDTSQSQTGAKGTYDFLFDKAATKDDAAKVINVPGCPTNPWWFILTIVAILMDIETIGGGGTPSLILTSDVVPDTDKLDSTRRFKAAYPTTIHGPYCPRFNDWAIGNFASQPGDDGCLQKIGCKGPAVKSLCGMHGWNAQQPNNDKAWEHGLAAANEISTNPGNYRGGHCTRAGHPCMGCTEKGYPDAFVPFVSWSS